MAAVVWSSCSCCSFLEIAGRRLSLWDTWQQRTGDLRTEASFSVHFVREARGITYWFRRLNHPQARPTCRRKQEKSLDVDNNQVWDVVHRKAYRLQKGEDHPGNKGFRRAGTIAQNRSPNQKPKKHVDVFSAAKRRARPPPITFPRIRRIIMPIQSIHTVRVAGFLKITGASVLLCGFWCRCATNRMMSTAVWVYLLNGPRTLVRSIRRIHPFPSHLRQVVSETGRARLEACVRTHQWRLGIEGRATWRFTVIFARLIRPLQESDIATHLTLGNHGQPRSVFTK